MRDDLEVVDAGKLAFHGVGAAGGEEAEFTHAKRGARARLLYFNPSDPRASVRWNPLSGIQTRSEAYDLAAMMVSASVPISSDGDGAFFVQQATLKLCLLFQAINQVAKGHGTLQAVREIVDGGAERVRALAKAAQSLELEAFAVEITSGNRNTETVLSQVGNVLLAWQDEAVCQTTSATDFDFNQLEKHPHVVLLGLPEEQVEKLRPLTNAFLHRFFQFVMSRGQKRGGQLRRPFVLFADEFASAVGKLPDFHVRANTLRKRGLAITAAVQTIAQLHEVYGASARSLEAAFNHWVFVPPLAQGDAQWASAQSGLTTVNELVTGAAGEVMSINPVTRPVLSPDEVARPPRDEALGPRISFLLADTPPFQGFLPGAWENPDWAAFVKLGVPFAPRVRRMKTCPPPDIKEILSRQSSTEAEFTNTAGWTPEQIRARIEEVKASSLDWPNTTGSAHNWWKIFESENAARLGLVLQLCEELKKRKATITEFFLAYVYSNTENIQANLYYLDYTRIKKEELSIKSSVPKKKKKTETDGSAVNYARCRHCSSIIDPGTACPLCMCSSNVNSLT